MKIGDIYHFVRRFLFEVMLFLFLQSVMMLVLAILVVLYPYTLNLLVALAFFIVGLISVYIMLRVGMIFHELKKMKKFLGK
ncbi:hypothetical protein COT97_04845 [Candidatus Falkowbacteria bacterium CG10_big_fil_rev_8_21_14_0_10_39_11]|uniref:Uncharacterized protein n=1 Tax=Candidatus Falkowbacteria bacterium CG10_big_fil_rev_8_21_14_0_10_39_11 TaxID=1974565 RepID=A0A2H0V3W1_9BACT|nr:MAG: hypothetical protein COT97_04845 [Candidatus Falkowbacteria bacterium CG10_big_fil_rev_8_21_14_0_10_39_11]